MNPLNVPCDIVNTRLVISLGRPRTVLYGKIWFLTTRFVWVFSDIKMR